MNYQKIVSESIEKSEQEKQEAEIKKIKDIVSRILTKIDDLKTKKIDLEKEIRVLQDDLDDLKAGRLDKIKERQDKDPEHNGYTLIIIKEIEKEYQPLYPWRSPWWIEVKPEVTWKGDYYTTTNNGFLTTSGTTFQNFCCGSYEINGRIINL